MKFKLILLCLMAVLVFLPAYGYTPEELDQAKNMYNSYLMGTPEFAQGFFGNERLHLIMTEAGDIKEYAAITQDGMITEMESWKDEDANNNHDSWQALGKVATFEVSFNFDTLKNIATSQDPIQSFRDAWGEDIVYKGLSIQAKIKVFFMNVGVALSGLFGGVVEVPVQSQSPILKIVGEVCSDGGECETGNCLYDSGEGAERIYRCSCEPLTLVIQNPCPMGSEPTP